jgi:hypothetical protein
MTMSTMATARMMITSVLAEGSSSPGTGVGTGVVIAPAVGVRPRVAFGVGVGLRVVMTTGVKVGWGAAAARIVPKRKVKPTKIKQRARGKAERFIGSQV